MDFRAVCSARSFWSLSCKWDAVVLQEYASAENKIVMFQNMPPYLCTKITTSQKVFKKIIFFLDFQAACRLDHREWSSAWFICWCWRGSWRSRSCTPRFPRICLNWGRMEKTKRRLTCPKHVGLLMAIKTQAKKEDEEHVWTVIGEGRRAAWRKVNYGSHWQEKQPGSCLSCKASHWYRIRPGSVNKMLMEAQCKERSHQILKCNSEQRFSIFR